MWYHGAVLWNSSTSCFPWPQSVSASLCRLTAGWTAGGASGDFSVDLSPLQLSAVRWLLSEFPPHTFLWPENFLKAVHAGKFGSLFHYFPFSHKSLIFAYIYVFKTVVYICPVFFFFLKEGEPFPTTSSRESSCLYFTWKKKLSCISL